LEGKSCPRLKLIMPFFKYEIHIFGHLS